MNEPISYRTEPNVIVHLEFLAPGARHAEYVDCSWRGACSVCMLSCERGERGAKAVPGDKERMPGPPTDSSRLVYSGLDGFKRSPESPSRGRPALRPRWSRSRRWWRGPHDRPSRRG